MGFSEVLLASTSVARRALMDGLGVPYRAVAPAVDEVVPAGTSVSDAVLQLAERKARAVAGRFPRALIIGSDQLVSRDGVALGKPPDAESAFAQLQSVRGRAHDILTAVCVTGPGFHRVELDVATLTVAPLEDEALRAYVATGEWQGCAGGYRVEARGQALFDRLEGDRTSIQGLPMQRVVRLLREAGVRFF